jgi:hypothetical protein
MARRVFVSFQYEDLRYANLMDAWAANENNDFSFYSERLRVPVKSSAASYIRTVLKAKIARSRVLVCLIGTGTWNSEGVTWEVATAKVLGKGLVGVQLAAGNSRPAEIQDAGAVFVPYKQHEIERAIEWAALSTARNDDFVYPS